MISRSKECFVSCPKGIENLLKDELTGLGAQVIRVSTSGVFIHAELVVAYRICLWSRLANRVLLPLMESEVNTTDEIYEFVSELPWEEHFTTKASLYIDFTGKHPEIRNTQFGAQKVKDGIVDRLRNTQNWRPNIDKQQADIRISAHVKRKRLSLSLDLSGMSLHRRGYRRVQGPAPLKENLAAALLLRSGWPNFDSLVDPMCGSGTFLIEAAMISADIAPGLNRNFYGFLAWQQHQAPLWQALREEAEARKEQGLNALHKPIYGFDMNQAAVDIARQNVRSAGLEGRIQVQQGKVDHLQRPAAVIDQAKGLVICNPPYGERLGEHEALKADYHQLAKVTKAQFPGWTLGVFTGNPELARETRLRPNKIYKLYNGRIPSEFLLYSLLSADKAYLRQDQNAIEDEQSAPISPGTEMLVNRLRKNQKRLATWLKTSGVSCYRLYDADMPEYSAAIDVYDQRIHIQEYAAPKTVDAGKAKRRWRELVRACALVFEQKNEDLALKVRHRNPGKKQYQKLSEASELALMAVEEGQAKFYVNLTDYLDTGLFLDHRPLRRMLYQQANGKRFLNLFCYTGTASIQAILGGAKASISVDMSNTYLDWAKKNFELNRIHSSQHQLVRADCLSWLRTCRQGFDIIMLDPPSFSNSKKMDGVLDIQRDHSALILRCMELLNPKGTLYFSCNLRSFKLNQDALAAYQVENISAQTLDPDFSHNKKIHYCWQIRHAEEN